MKLAADDIREFSNLWQEEFGEPISLDDARASASALLDLYTLLAQLPKDNGPHPRAEHLGESFS